MTSQPDSADSAVPAVERSNSEAQTVLVVDYGAQYAQLIARRVREARVYSEVVPHTLAASEIISRNPSAVILSGGPSSVYAEGAPAVESELFEAGIPVMGICYGFQASPTTPGSARTMRTRCSRSAPPTVSSTRCPRAAPETGSACS